MNDLKSLNKRYEIAVWGLGFIWIGILGLVPGNQAGIGLLGIGVILLGLNLARYIKKIPVNGFSIVLGVLSSALGMAGLVRQMLGYPSLDLDLFALILVITGLYILIPSPKQIQSA